MSVYMRARSPYWQIDITVAGHRLIRSTGTIDKREAKALERKWRAELEAKIGRGRTRGLTLNEACGRWWLEKGQTLKRGKKDEERHLRTIVGTLGTTIELSAVTNADVARVSAGIEINGPKPAAVNRCLATFRQVLRRARRLWGEDVADIHWPEHWRQEAEGRTRWITLTEAERLLAVSPDPLRVAIEWSLQTGTRKAETYRIRWAHVDFDRGQVQIIAGKTGSRVVWLTDDTRALLLSLRPVSPNPDAFVFDGRNQRKLWEAAVKAAGLADFHWHDLRHTAATWLRQKGAPLEVVGRVLGHASITTTQRYAHVDDVEVKEALAKLPGLGKAADGNVVPLKRRKRE